MLRYFVTMLLVLFASYEVYGCEKLGNETVDLFYKLTFSDLPEIEKYLQQYDNHTSHKYHFSHRHSISFPTSLSNEQFQKTLLSSVEPKWAQGNIFSVEQYYSLHGETILDRLLRFVACHVLGVIVHGNMNQAELARHLDSFNIQQLMSQGPYKNSTLSIEAQQLILDSLIEIDDVYDVHLHNLGYDEGNYLNPKASVRGLATWKDYFTFLVIRYAAGQTDPIGSTNEARKRIHLYAAHFPKLKAIVLPIHKAIHEDGFVDWNKTGNFLKNQSAWITAVSFQDSHSKIYAAVSVHPFDKKWKIKLLKAYEKGIRLVKWMPPQSIPPDSPKLKEFYQTLSDLKMTLIAHTGPEHTIPTSEENREWEDYGNPLRFRLALERGVDVIMAHCGHRDRIPDLDHPDKPLVTGLQLFLRIAREAYQKNQSGEWKGKVYGDLAAVTTHYGVEFVKELLMHVNEPGIRYIYGSDYPHINLIQPGKDAYDLCAKAGLLTRSKVKPLKEIRKWNPLLANYVFTRNIEMKKESGEIIRFQIETFTGDFGADALQLCKEE